MNDIGHLPHELILLILEHITENKDLVVCTQISRSFYDATIPLLWNRLYISTLYRLTNISHGMSTSPRSPSIHVRSLTIQWKLYDLEFSALIQHVPLLEELRLLEAHRITDRSFQQVGQRCPLLTTLEIHNANITFVSMVALGHSCRRYLSSLTLVACPHLDNPKLFSTLHRCNRSLRIVDIRPCELNSHQKSRQLAQAAALSLQDATDLTRLRLGHYANDYAALLSTPPPTTTMMTRALVVWPNLTELHLDACHTLDDAAMIRFLQTHPALQSLSVTTTRLTDRTLDDAITPLYLPNITEIRIDISPALTIAGLCRLVKRYSQISNLKKRGIHFYGCNIFWQDADFPMEQLQGHYRVDTMNGGAEVIWLSGRAFNDDDNNH